MKTIGLSTYLNVFYGQGPPANVPPEGKVIDRLIFSNDYQIEYIRKGFFAAMVPQSDIEMRKKFHTRSCCRRKLFFDPDKSHFDIGGAISSGYKIKLAKKILTRP
jgi:hypothetical protein